MKRSNKIPVGQKCFLKMKRKPIPKKRNKPIAKKPNKPVAKKRNKPRNRGNANAKTNLWLFNSITAKWLPYAPIGNQVPGTRFIAFKVPLKEPFVDKLKPEDRFTISILLDRVPELGLIIDLTQTVKYYNKNEVLDRGVDYVKIPTPGQAVPAQQYVERFFEVVDYFLETHKGDGSLIGVHCTHGVNRTGYMLCRYLIQRLGYSYEEAVEAVGTARGHMIERSPYLASLRLHTEVVKKKTIRGDLEEGKPKMPKKNVKSPKKPEPQRPVETNEDQTEHLPSKGAIVRKRRKLIEKLLDWKVKQLELESKKIIAAASHFKEKDFFMEEEMFDEDVVGYSE